jgi:hypothetical protein
MGNVKHKIRYDQEEIPWLTALRILGLAHPHFQAKRGIGFGKLIMKYQAGEVKITRLQGEPTAPPGTYLVQVAGSSVTVVDKEELN